MDEAVNRVVLNLDKPRTFRLDLQTLSDLQQYLKVGMEELGNFFNEIRGPNGVEKLKVLLWIGLKQEDPSLTLDQIGRMVGLPALFQMLPLLSGHIAYANASGGDGKNLKGAATEAESGIGESPSKPLAE